ncbi:hypothetical protein OS493_001676 [Desmophyllum pertusum]|uniref:DUF4503 domain-containing protein n=1 Tax=Desmophyllum pertusum TaxID=174260 RepID=A0A9W9ZGW5_9CNID|nr:hypothetical protein OS493_001676 [Desmophyllum pertusum]
MAKSANEDGNEEIRWTLLVQDIHGMCAEIQVPQTFQDSFDWNSCIVKGEGKVYTFSHVKVIQRTNRLRSAGLFSLIQSLWCSHDDNTITSDTGNSQIVTQESGSQDSNSSSPPNFCYVLTVQESSHASLCQDVVFSEGLLLKPCAFRALWDVLHNKDVKRERINTLCKLLYCRIIGPSAVDELHNSSFELFVTDSSLQNATESEGPSDELLGYVKIIGKSNHVLPPDLRQVPRTNYAMTLTAKQLVVTVQASHELVADSYSVIRKAVTQSTTFHEESVQQDILDSLTNIKPVCFPSLTRHSCLGYVYLIEAVVTGVVEETACCWLVCDTCGNPDITVKHGANSQFFCSSCNRAVESPQTRTHLTVLVKVKSFPDAHVKVTLLQSTIDKLLPVSYQDSDQGYDIEAVLGKQPGV